MRLSFISSFAFYLPFIFIFLFVFALYFFFAVLRLFAIFFHHWFFISSCFELCSSSVCRFLILFRFLTFFYRFSACFFLPAHWQPIKFSLSFLLHHSLLTILLFVLLSPLFMTFYEFRHYLTSSSLTGIAASAWRHLYEDANTDELSFIHATGINKASFSFPSQLSLQCRLKLIFMFVGNISNSFTTAI
jgi:hypothetical protein